MIIVTPLYKRKYSSHLKTKPVNMRKGKGLLELNGLTSTSNGKLRGAKFGKTWEAKLKD